MTTVEQLYAELGKLIEQGKGKVLVGHKDDEWGDINLINLPVEEKLVPTGLEYADDHLEYRTPDDYVIYLKDSEYTESIICV